MHINENADITYEIELELSKKINLYHNFLYQYQKLSMILRLKNLC